LRNKRGETRFVLGQKKRRDNRPDGETKEIEKGGRRNLSTNFFCQEGKGQKNSGKCGGKKKGTREKATARKKMGKPIVRGGGFRRKAGKMGGATRGGSKAKEGESFFFFADAATPLESLCKKRKKKKSNRVREVLKREATS